MRPNPAPSALWTRGQRPPAAFHLNRRCPPHHAAPTPEAFLLPPCRLRQRPALEHHPVLIGRRPAASPPGWWLNSYPPLPEEPLRLRPSDPKARPRPSNANAHTACLPSRSRERLDPACLAASLAPSCLLQPKAQTRDRASHCSHPTTPNRKPQPFFLQTRGHRPPSSDLTDTRSSLQPQGQTSPSPCLGRPDAHHPARPQPGQRG